MKKNLYATFIFIVMAIASVAQLPSYVPTNGLYAWYSFSGNADDVSGNAHQGAVTNAILCPDRYGNADAAYSFDGDGDYIELAGTDTFSGTNGFTLAAWVYYPNGATGAVITKHLNGSQNGFTLGTSNSNAVMAINNGSAFTIYSPQLYNDSN